MTFVKRYLRELLAVAGVCSFVAAGRLAVTPLVMVNVAVCLVVCWLVTDPWDLLSVVMMRRTRLMLAAAIAIDTAALELPGLDISVRLGAGAVTGFLALIWMRHRDAWHISQRFGQSQHENLTLSHYTKDGEWDAGKSWTERGRAEVAGFVRQGLGQIVEEKVLDKILRPSYQIGYMDGSEKSRKALEKSQRRVEALQASEQRAWDQVAEYREREEERIDFVSEREQFDATIQRHKNQIRDLKAEVSELRDRLQLFEEAEPEQDAGSRDAEMLRLYDVEGMSYAAIGKRYGLSKDGARSAINRERLRQQTEETQVPVLHEVKADIRAG